jgi:hypothetical protein
VTDRVLNLPKDATKDCPVSIGWRRWFFALEMSCRKSQDKRSRVGVAVSTSTSTASPLVSASAGARRRMLFIDHGEREIMEATSS